MEELLEPWLRKKRIKQVKNYIKKNGMLCDIGCGTKPKLLIDLSNYIKKGIGIDKKAQNSNKFPENITIKKALLNKKLPFKNKQFDNITMLAVLEHLSKPLALLKECHRVLKEKGILIITIPSKKSQKLLEIMAKIKLVNPDEIKDHKNYWNKKELEYILKKTGFKNIKISNYNLTLNILATATPKK